MMGKKAINKTAEQQPTLQCGIFNIVVMWNPNVPEAKNFVYLTRSGLWPKKYNGLEILGSALTRAIESITENLKAEYIKEADMVKLEGLARNSEAADKPLMN